MEDTIQNKNVPSTNSTAVAIAGAIAEAGIRYEPDPLDRVKRNMLSREEIKRRKARRKREKASRRVNRKN